MTFTQAQAAQIVKDALGINLSDYKQTNMEMFFVNTSNGTASWMTRKNNPLAAEYLSTDLGGSFTNVQAYADGTVVLETESGLTGYSYLNGGVRKKYKMTSTLRFVDSVLIRTNWSELNDVIISQFAVKNTSQIALARVKFDMYVDTVENVIHAMATSKWYYKFAPSIINQLTCEITTVPDGNRMHVSYKLFKSGVEIQAKKVRWQVCPTDVAFAASAQFPTQNEFTITNDLTNREDFAVMASNSVKITCMPTTHEDDGDLVSIQKEAVYSLGFTPKQYF